MSRSHGRINCSVTRTSPDPQDRQALRDRDLIHLVLEHHAFDDLQFDGEHPREVFDGWLKRLVNNNCTRPLTEKQRKWLEGVAGRLDIEIGAMNLISSGAVKVKPKERESLQTFLGTLQRPTLPPHRRCQVKSGCLKQRHHPGECEP